MEGKSFCRLPAVLSMLIFVLSLSMAAGPAMAAETEKVYVSLQDGSKVFVFDPVANRFSATIDIYAPTRLARALPPNINDILYAGGKVWLTVPGAEVSQFGLNQVVLLDPVTQKPVNSMKAGITPSGLLLHDGKVYVVNRFGGTIEEIEAATFRPLRSIPFPVPKPGSVNNPLFLEIANNKIYLPFPGGSSRPGAIQVLDLASGKLIKTIDFTPFGNYGPMAVKRVGENKIYLGGLNNILVLDTSTDTIAKTIPLSSSPLYVQSFALLGNKVYAANGVSTVSVVDRAKDVFLKEIDTGYHSYACHLRAGIAASDNRVYVGDAGRGLKIIDATTDTLLATARSEEPLGAIAVVPLKGPSK